MEAFVFSLLVPPMLFLLGICYWVMYRVVLSACGIKPLFDDSDSDY